MSGGTYDRSEYKYYTALQEHNLSNDELEALWPYVAAVEQHSVIKLGLVLIVFGILALPIGVFFGLFIAGLGLQTPNIPALLTVPVGFAIVIMTVLYVPLLWYQAYTGHKWVKQIKSDLKENPRTILDDPSNRDYLNPDMIENAGQVYPPDATVTVDKQQVTQNISGRSVRDTLSEITSKITS